MATAPPMPAQLRRSRHLSTFAHQGAVYLFHDLYGYILQMSPDIVGLIDAFGTGAATSEIAARYAGAFGEQTPEQFIDVLLQHAVLVEPAGQQNGHDEEVDAMWLMVPVKGKWNAWRRHGDRLTLWTAWGDRPVTTIELDAADTAIWDDVDGERRLAQLTERHDRARVIALAQRLVHSDVQAWKLAHMPMSTFKKRPALAPRYLASTMPYRAWKPGEPVPGDAGGGDPNEMSPTAYYRDDVRDAQAQFDHQETTLSHLLRVPHPALAGRTYGVALVDALVARGRLPASGRIRVLETGGGLGYVAAAACRALFDRGLAVEYTIVEVAPALAAAQRARCAGLPVTVREADVLAIDLGEASFDLIISNEMVGDLPARQLSRGDVGLAPPGEDDDSISADERTRRLDALGPTGALIRDLGLEMRDAPEPFFLMTGALDLVGRIARWLAPGGTAVITEFGERAVWPRLSTHLDHPELSTHFGHLEQAARRHGLGSEYAFVIDLLDVDRAQQGLATTRSHFRALVALFAAAGVTLEKIGYTPAMLEAVVTGKLDLADVGELRWDKIEDRLMGLVPHEFKALLVTRPAATAA